MVSKKNFAQGGRQMPYRKPQMFKGANQFNNNQMFNASQIQIPDQSLYKDFNVDFNQPAPNNANNNPQNMQTPKKKNQKGKQKMKQNQQQQQQQIGQNNGGQWPKNRNNQQKMHGGPGGPNKFRPNSQRNFQPGNGAPMPMRGGNNMGRGMRMMPPMPPHGFQRPPMMPPIPHMRPMRPLPPVPVGHLTPNGPPFLRRSARRPQGNGNFGNQGGGGAGGPYKKQMFQNQMPPMIPPMPPMMAAGPPRMPMPFNNAGVPNLGKIKKPNPKIVKKIVKGKSTIKTLKNLQNQFPLDKPWVTDEIRAEHAKKVEIENQLKGKKDDELFAQFKTQRDKFVGMYETARDEHLKKEASDVKTKDANGKETNNKTAGKSGKGNENNENSNA